MTAIAPIAPIVAIDRPALLERINAIEFDLCPRLMAHGLANNELRDPAHMCAGHLYDLASQLRAGLAEGHSDERLQIPFLTLDLYESSAGVWLERQTRWPHLEEADALA